MVDHCKLNHVLAGMSLLIDGCYTSLFITRVNEVSYKQGRQPVHRFVYRSSNRYPVMIVRYGKKGAARNDPSDNPRRHLALALALTLALRWPSN